MHIRRVVPLLHVRDMAASLGFYRGAFGAQLISSWPATGDIRWAYVRSGNLALMMFQPRKGPRAREGEKESLVFYLTVDDADATYEALRGKGYQVTEPKDHSYGFREFYVADPDGNRFAIGHGIPVSP